MMTDDTIRAVLDRYEQEIPKHMAPDYHWDEPARRAFEHLLTMIPRMRALLPTPGICVTCGESAFKHGVFGFRDHAPRDAAGRELEDEPHMEPEAREKVMRWLGFIQGVLYAKGIYTIDEMRAHNKPDEPT